MHFTIIPKVRKEYLEALVWYENIEVGLGSRFENEIDKVYSKIKFNPQTYTYINK